MSKKNEAHDMVIESLTEALLQLMEKKPLSEIKVSELCRRAGVSRVSFYRNFWPELLKLYRQNEKLVKLLYAHHVSYLLKEHIFTCCGPVPEQDDQTAFCRAVLAGSLYGFVDEWVHRGMPEISPDFSPIMQPSHK